MVLQPSDERRRSGSHYTPRTLTEPIVETTFRPILERLGPNPTPEQILDLKVCDPAMGSGAFLVAVCRFLAELLVKAWHAHNACRSIPPDEDEILHARRIVAQRCLYGVDKNPMAVDLAKLSLWLATLAKDHPFTFLDHALRCGDSLVGLSKNQIVGFHWKPEKQRDFLAAVIEDRLNPSHEHRREIREAADGDAEALLSEKLAADEALEPRPPLRRSGHRRVLRGARTISNGRSTSSDLRMRSQPNELSPTSTRQQSAGRRTWDLLEETHPLIRFTGRSSSPRCSAERCRVSTCLWAIRHSWEERRSPQRTDEAYLDWLMSFIESPTAMET